MPIYFQGFYQEFGYNNIYDPWSSYFLNMDNGNQLYKLIQRNSTELGINCEIYCYCHHHQTWDKVFIFFRTPSKSFNKSKFILSDSMYSRPTQKVICEILISNLSIETCLSEKGMLRHIDNSDVPHDKTEMFFLDTLLNLQSKNIKFEKTSDESLSKYIK
jgi:hypothetical protein